MSYPANNEVVDAIVEAIGVTAKKSAEASSSETAQNYAAATKELAEALSLIGLKVTYVA
jgi:hypothetical protein